MDQYGKAHQDGQGGGHFPGDGEIVAASHGHSGAQGGEVPGQDRQSPVEGDKVVGNPPGNAGQMHDQAAEQQTVGQGGEQEEDRTDADVVGHRYPQAQFPGHTSEHKLHHIKRGQRGEEQHAPADPFGPAPDPGGLHIILFQNYNNSRINYRIRKNCAVQPALGRGYYSTFSDKSQKMPCFYWISPQSTSHYSTIFFFLRRNVKNSCNKFKNSLQFSQYETVPGWRFSGLARADCLQGTSPAGLFVV